VRLIKMVYFHYSIRITLIISEVVQLSRLSECSMKVFSNKACSLDKDGM